MSFTRFSSFGVMIGSIVVLALAGCNGHADRDTEEVAAVQDAVENQQFCPVMEGMAIDRNIYVDHEGKRVYFCCPGCIATFNEDPEQYLAKLKTRQADDTAAPVEATPDEAAHEGHGHEHDPAQ